MRLRILAFVLAFPATAAAGDSFHLESTMKFKKFIFESCSDESDLSTTVVLDVPLTTGDDGKLRGEGWFRHKAFTAPDTVTCPTSEGDDEMTCVLQDKVLLDYQASVEFEMDASGETVRKAMILPQSPSASITYLCKSTRREELVAIPLPTIPWWFAGFARMRQPEMASLDQIFGGMGHRQREQPAGLGFKLDGMVKVPDPRGTVFRKEWHRDDPDPDDNLFHEDTVAELIREGPAVKYARSAYRQFFLKGISAENVYEADVDWKDATLERKVFFKSGITQKEIRAEGSLTRATFDVGQELDQTSGDVEVWAEAKGVKSARVRVDNVMITPPGWFFPNVDVERIAGGPGIRYQGLVRWPKNFDAKKTIEQNVPFIAGNWGLIPYGDTNASNVSEMWVYADSNGAPTAGTLQGKARFKFATEEVEIDYRGKHSTKLSTEGMTLFGDAEVMMDDVRYGGRLGPRNPSGVFSGAGLAPVKLAYTKNISWIQVFPQIAAACAAPLPVAIPPFQSLKEEICENLTFGLRFRFHAEATFGLTAEYIGYPNKNEIEFGRFGARSDADANLELRVGFDWIANVSIKAGVCGNLHLKAVQAIPPIEVKEWGGKVYLRGQAEFFGTMFGPWPNPGTIDFGPNSNCRLAYTEADSPTHGWLASAGPVRSPVRGPIERTASIAFAGAAQVIAEAHVAPVEGKAGPVSRIEVRTSAGAGKPWSASVAVSDDAHLTLQPAIELDSSKRPLVVWSQSTTDFTKSGSANFEIAWASVDAGRVVKSGTLTQDTAFDVLPRLCRFDATRTLAVWQKTNGSTLMGKAKDPLSLHAALWNGSAWTPVESVLAAPVTGMLDWDLSCSGNGRAAIAWTADGDASYRTPNDRDVRVVTRDATRWSAPRTIGASDAVADEGPHGVWLDGSKLHVVWTRGNDLVAQSADGGTRMTVASFKDGAPSLSQGGSVVQGAKGHLIVAWRSGRGWWMTGAKPGTPFPRPSMLNVPEEGTVERAGRLLLSERNLYFARLVAPDGGGNGEVQVIEWKPEESK